MQTQIQPGQISDDLIKFYHLDITLTDAEIKALPSTPVVLIPSTQTLGYSGAPSSIPILQTGWLRVDARAGAYTNVAPEMHISLAWGSDWSWDACKLHIPDLFSQAKFQHFAIPFMLGQDETIPTAEADPHGHTLIHSILDLDSQIQDNAIVVAVSNFGAGDFTGGHASNSMRIRATYVIEDLS